MKLVELNREKLIEQDMEPLTEVSTSEVYRLRREGKFDESYRMACELMKQPNSGERELKAYGYLLMSLIRRSVEGNDEKSLTTYVKELRSIIVHGDDVFTRNQEKAIRMGNQGYKQVEKLLQERRYKEAARVARDIYQNHPNDVGIERLYCQALFNVVKEEAAKPSPKGHSIKAYIDAYFGIQGKSRAFYDAYIWSHISKLENDQGSLQVGTYYLATINMGLPINAYRGESKERMPNTAQKGPDHWPSMYGRMTKYVLDNLLTCKNLEQMKTVCESVAGNESKLDEDEAWVITWKRGKVLMACRAYDEARQCVLQIIERKGKEYWAWSALGDTYVAEDEKLAESAYCKALLCRPPLKFGAPLKLKLVKLLVKEQLFEEASVEVDEILSTPAEVGKKVYEEAEKLSQSSWYVGGLEKKGNRGLYQNRKHAVLAELYQSIPWSNGMMLRIFTLNQKKFYKFAFAVEVGSVPVEVMVTKVELDSIIFEAGKCVRAKLEWYTDEKGREKAKVLMMEEILPIENFLPMEYGIIQYINREKNVAHIMTKEGDILYLQNASSYKLGLYTPVKVTYTEYRGPHGRKNNTVQSIEVISQSEIKDMKAHVRGTVSLENGYYRAVLKKSDYTCLDDESSVEKDIIIDHRLVDEHSLAEGVTVEGIALRQYDKRGNKGSWRLVDITDLSYDR